MNSYIVYRIMEVMLERKTSQRHSSREKHRDLQREVSGGFQDYRDIQYEYQDDRVPTYVSSSYQVYTIYQGFVCNLIYF